MQTSQVSVEIGAGEKSGLDFAALRLAGEGLTGFFAPRHQVDGMLKDLSQAGMRPVYNEEYGC